MGATKDMLLTLSDHISARILARVQGLTDEEYRWTPVDDCWTAGADDRGGFFADGVTPAPEPPPFTTLAWRMHHLMECYSADRGARWLELESTGDPLEDAATLPTDAARAVALLERCQLTWRGYLTAATEEVLLAPLGAKAGGYASASGADFVLHQIDEQIHHGAEIALLRDLYRAVVTDVGDPSIVALLHGDRAVIDRERIDVEALRRDRPDLLTEAASRGRWNGVLLLAELGFGVDNPGGLSALHLAAGAGRVDVVRALVARGADPTAVDPEYHATPRGWAEFFGQVEAAEVIRALEAAR